nr:MAG TPA: hypothetical protein [Caudoviricetes sp.]
MYPLINQWIRLHINLILTLLQMDLLVKKILLFM